MIENSEEDGTKAEICGRLAWWKSIVHKGWGNEIGEER